MIATLLSLMLLAAAPPAAHAGQPAQPPGSGAGPAPTTLVIDMQGFRNTRGAALVAVFASAKGFPSHSEDAVRRLQVPIHGSQARAVVRGLPPGVYAVAVLHDENGDKKMKTGMFGIPKEGFGASRDARGRFGPPHVDDARFSMPAGRTVTIRLHMVYY